MEFDFEKIFKITMTSLKINGAHPDNRRDLYWALHFFIMHGIYTMGITMVLVSTMLTDIRNDITQLCSNMSFMVVYGIISFKYYVLVKHQQIFVSIIKSMKQDFEVAQTLSEYEQKIVNKFALKGQMVIKYWRVLCILTTILFTCKPLVIMIYIGIVDNRFELVPVYNIVYPEVIQNMNGAIVYAVTFLLVAYFVTYSCFMYVGMAPLGLIFLTHASGQLELLKFKVLQLYSQDEEFSAEERTQRLRIIAIRLQEIYNFVDNIRSSFKLLYEFTLKGTSLILPVLAYCMIESFGVGEIKVEFIAVFNGAIVLSGGPCYYGDMLIEKSTDLREAVYMCGWERLWEKKARNTLMVLMTRMERSISINTMFRVICLESLTEVYRQAYTLFNVFRAA